MKNKTFEELQNSFGKSYGFGGDEYWRPNQKEYKELKTKIEKILQQEVTK